ncbi:hypothetical protein ACFLY9_00580 [Patescibacteria group bacterium]
MNEQSELIQNSSTESISPYLQQLAGLYAEIFAAPPWNEVGKCPTCENFFPEKGGMCPNDNSTIKEAYPLDSTIEYIKEELNKPLCFYVLSISPKREPVSFGWGYACSIVELVKAKYSQDEQVQAGAQDLLSQSLTLNPDSQVFYISEIGTAPAWREKGLASKLCRCLLAQANRLSLPVVTRTLVDSPSIYGIARNLRMKQISGCIRDSDEVIDGFDVINSRRVLFVSSNLFLFAKLL